MSFTLPNIKEAESRIDQVFDRAFMAEDPPMQDWVAVKFALKELAEYKVFAEKVAMTNTNAWYPMSNRDQLSRLVHEARTLTKKKPVFGPTPIGPAEPELIYDNSPHLP